MQKQARKSPKLLQQPLQQDGGSDSGHGRPGGGKAGGQAETQGQAGAGARARGGFRRRARHSDPFPRSGRTRSDGRPGRGAFKILKLNNIQ